MLHRPSTAQKLFYYSMLVLLALIIIFPIYSMITISFKLPRDIYREPSLLLTNATLINYVELFTSRNFLINIRNSLITSSSATIISVAISCLAAYSLVRLRYPGRTQN